MAWTRSRDREHAACNLRVSAEGYAASRTTSAAIVDPPAEQNVILLYPGVTVRGTVRDARSGEPIPGVTVKLVSGAAADRFFRRVMTQSRSDETGRFSIRSVPSGTNRLALTHRERPQATFGPFEVARGPGELEVHPRMAQGVALRGRVVGFENAAGWTVTAQRFSETRSYRAEVQRDFSFELEGLGVGTHVLGLRDPLGYRRTIYVVVGESDVEGVEIAAREGTGALRAEVRGLERGYAQVEAVSDAPRSQRPASHWFPFRAGRFVVEGLAPGKYRVSVYAVNRPTEATLEVEVGTGELPIVIEVSG